MQPVDFTTLTAACSELRAQWLPARLEQVYQRDRFTVSLALRTMKGRGWIDLCWHPVAARICVGDPPPRIPDTFTFSEQLRHQLSGLALVSIAPVASWERVIDLQFAKRPGEPALWHLYAEIMGKYSNVILTAQDNLVVTCAHQVSAKQSTVRPIQTGQPYEMPPSLTDAVPSLSESQNRWQSRISLVPGQLHRNLLKNYRGLSKALIFSMIRSASLDPEHSTDSLNPDQWQQLFQRWLYWLQCLENSKFHPSFTPEGYTVIDWPAPDRTTEAQPQDLLGNESDSSSSSPVFTLSEAEKPSSFSSVQEILNSYYTDQINQEVFAQLRHQLTQKLNSALAKLRLKANTFKERLQQSADADTHKSQADLLMANLQHWEPGMKSISLPDFETEKPVIIPLNPEKNAVQNAQAIYKKHQKLKRARIAVEP